MTLAPSETYARPYGSGVPRIISDKGEATEVLKKLAKRVISKTTGARFPQYAKSLPHDDFLMWLKFINPGMLDPGNLYAIDWCLEHLPPAEGAVIEIGSFAGLSLNCILYLLGRHQRKNPVYSVDAWHFEHVNSETIPGSTVRFDDYREHVVETYRRNLLLFSGNRLPRHIELDSNAFFEAWDSRRNVVDFFGQQASLGGPIVFAYIDGDHTYEQSMLDFINVDRSLAPGGFIVFDDSAEGLNFGSVRTAKEVAARPTYRLVHANPNYCVQKIA